MKVDEFKEILYEKDEEGIVTITFNAPERKNAFSPLTVVEIYWAMDAVEKDDTARAVIFTGAKDPRSSDPKKEAFSSGAYFNPKFLEGLRPDVKSEIDLSDPAQKRLFIKMWGINKPIIAAINGLAIGFGFTMPLGCADLIYASEHAWMQLPFVTLAIAPEFASTYILPGLIGMQKTKEIMFFGEPITAQQAFELNIINKVLPHNELIPFAREKARKLIPPRGAGLALGVVKQALHRPLMDRLSAALDLENEALNKLFTTSDFREAIAARMGKRSPAFKGA
jgi:enoyl-CoA hydratase/carnithine racemase